MNDINLLPEKSEKFDIVLKQLMHAKREMGSSVRKDATNPFHKSKYASLGAHLDLCESTLDKHGLILLHAVNGSYDKPVLVADLCHPESGQWLKSYLPLPNPKNDSQGLGASLTYMRRYSINSMLGLSAEDDDGESACVREKAKPFEKPFEKKNLVGSDLTIITGLASKLSPENHKAFMKVIKDKYNADSLSQIPVEAFQACITSMSAKVKLQNELVTA